MENSQNTFKKGCVILTQPFLYPFTISQQAPQKHPASLPPQCLTTPPSHRLTATAMPYRHSNASPPHRHRNASPPHRLTVSPPHRHTVGSRLDATEPLTPPCSLCPHRRTATLHAPPMPLCPPCHNVGSRHGATEPPSQPRSGNCRLTAHRDAPHGPPHCHPARSTDATLPTLPQCRVAPWCDPTFWLGLGYRVGGKH